MSATNLQTISLITPPGAVMLGWLIGGEKFPLWSLLGACLVLAGVWVIFRKSAPARLVAQKRTDETSVSMPRA
jgi:drug/metabolite transporter (DMT)-like permease